MDTRSTSRRNPAPVASTRDRYTGSAAWLLPVVLAFAACRSGADSGLPPTVRSTTRVGAADPARVTADVAWLADDAREGRRAGTAAALEAAGWLAARFESLGLEPAGDSIDESASWFQDFDVPLPARDGGGSRIELFDGEGRSASFATPDVTPLFCSEGGAIQGALVFAGYGIVHEDADWDDYENIDAEGAVVVVVRGAPPAKEDPGEGEGTGAGLGNATSIFHKVMAAKRAGAAAVLLAQHPRNAGEPLLSFDEGRSARAGIPALTVTAETAAALIPSFELSLANYDRAMLQIFDHTMVTLSVRKPDPVRVDCRADVERAEGRATNVLARLPGSRGGDTVVVGAHYDHLGRGGSGSLAPGGRGEIHNGADDNASGTAAVLELARLMTDAPAPAGDVVFALWSGEELGLLGSEHWARHPTIPLEDVEANLNLDMVGRAGDGVLQVLGAGTAEAFQGMLRRAGEVADLELTVSLSGRGLGGSDHQTFLKREIPALHLFSGVHTDYHKPSDDIERFEPEGAARVVNLCVELVHEMQAADLAYLEPEVQGDEPHGPAGWSVWFGSVPEYASDEKGLLLAGTSAGSPAENAGLLKGDLIVGVDDVEIEGIYDFMYVLQIHKPGDVLRTRYVRDGRLEQVVVTLASRELE